jgi:hypothetical protein
VGDEQNAWEPSDPLLRAVAEHWEEILAIASDEQRERLKALVSGAAESEPVEARAAIADELLEILPGDHQVIRVLRARVLYGTGTRNSGVVELADSLRRLSLLVLPAGGSAWPGGEREEPGRPGDSGAMATSDFDRRVQSRLLRLPALSPDELIEDETGPAGSHLIRLPRPDRTWQLPAFQFTSAARPWPIVQEVNELLGAEIDPWGVTCWWVDPHEQLNGSPADLLGTGQDALLRQAALAIGEDF